MSVPGRPRKTETEKLAEQFDKYDEEVKALTQDAMNKAPLRVEEPQTKLSMKEMNAMDTPIIKPSKTFPPGQDEKFNEKFRSEYESQKELVDVICENKEVLGETITLWSKKYPGVNCEMYEIPVNKPVRIPKYVANQISNCRYHVLKSVDKPISETGEGTYYGSLVVSETVNRLDANLAPKKTLISVGRFN